MDRTTKRSSIKGRNCIEGKLATELANLQVKKWRLEPPLTTLNDAPVARVQPKRAAANEV